MMRLFESRENEAVQAMLEGTCVHRDRSPVATRLQAMLSDDVFGFLSHLEFSAVEDVYLFRLGVACARSVYFDELGGIFRWNHIQRMYRSEGATVYVRGLQRHHSGIKRLLAELAPLYPGRKLFANLFLSPPRAVGLKAHFDPTDFLVFQLDGSKLWNIWDGPSAAQADAMLPEEVAAYSADIERRVAPSSWHHLLPGDALCTSAHRSRSVDHHRAFDSRHGGIGRALAENTRPRKCRLVCPLA